MGSLHWPRVVVAVIDSGYLDNNDLQPNLLPGYDMISSTRPFSNLQCILGGLNPGCGGSDDGDGRDADAFDARASRTAPTLREPSRR